MTRELLATAKRLAKPGHGKLRQSDLKRAISTAYYALFHAVAADCADRLIGVGRNRANKAWAQTYRALQHGEAKNACAQLRSLGFPASLVDVGVTFALLQEQRQKADYDPFHRVNGADALAAIALAEDGIQSLKSSSVRDRTAFAALLLLKRR